jgi:hypothetical protein
VNPFLLALHITQVLIAMGSKLILCTSLRKMVAFSRPLTASEQLQDTTGSVQLVS